MGTNRDDRRLLRSLSASLAPRVPRKLVARTEVARGLNDRFQGRSDVWVLEQPPDGQADDVVNALVSCERERSQESVLGLGESQGECLERFLADGVHQCTMT